MKVHLSHDPRDRHLVATIADALTQQGLTVTQSAASDSPGEYRPAAGDAHVVVVSASTSFGPWLHFELGLAQAAGARVVTLLLPGASADDLPQRLQAGTVVDASRLPLERAVPRLRDALGGGSFPEPIAEAKVIPKPATKFQSERHEDWTVIHIRGDFDSFYVPLLSEIVDQELEQGVTQIVLHMRLVKFVNSSALGGMLRAQKRCRAEGGEMVVAQPSPFVRQVMKTLKLDKLVRSFDTLGAAQEYLSARAPAAQTPQEGDIAFVLGSEASAPPRRGTILAVDQNHVRFRVDRRAAEGVITGAPIAAKFTVRLIQAKPFELQGIVESVDDGAGDAGIVEARWTGIGQSERLSLAQFADDLAFLKSQVRQQH